MISEEYVLLIERQLEGRGTGVESDTDALKSSTSLLEVSQVMRIKNEQNRSVMTKGVTRGVPCDDNRELVTFVESNIQPSFTWRIC